MFPVPTVFVSPLRGEWIEIFFALLPALAILVSPLRGEWIEILPAYNAHGWAVGLASQRRVD